MGDQRGGHKASSCFMQMLTDRCESRYRLDSNVAKDIMNVKTELGTLEWETINPECLIRTSNVDTFDFLLNPLFFGYSTEKSKTGFSKLESASRFCILS